MEALTYYTKANLVFAVLFSIYHLALRRETWFHARRAWLLGTALLAVLLPLMPSLPSSAPAMTFALPTIETASDAASNGFDWMPYLVMAHIGISITLLLWLGVRCLRVVLGLRRAVNVPGSFFHAVRLPGHVTGSDRDALLAHERVHAEQGHSFDVIAYEILAALFWSNPLWRVALRELRLVHEHTADSVARASHTDYDGLLLAHALGVPTTSLLNSFGTSNLKKRMIMMHNNRSPRLARRKLLLALPAVLLATALVSWQVVPRADAGARSVKARVFAGVDQQPEFPGGLEALARYLQENLRYPQAAKEVKAEGTVFVGFTVKANGQVTAVNVKRGVRADMDQESVRVVKAMPAWKPGMSKGKAVDAEMTLPIAFRLGEGK